MDVVSMIVNVTTEVDEDQFSLITGGNLVVGGFVKQAYRRRTNLVLSLPYGVHELESPEGGYLGWALWDEAIREREVYVCPIVQYATSSTGLAAVACLLLLKVE
jgi:hypothetical protein